MRYGTRKVLLMLSIADRAIDCLRPKSHRRLWTRSIACSHALAIRHWLWAVHSSLRRIGIGGCICLCLTAQPLVTTAATLEGKVIAVADGDTLTILDASKLQHKIRIDGIDAPEKGQAFGQRSKEHLSRMAHGKPAKAECQKKDRYERHVCIVWVQPSDCPSCGLTLDVGYAQIALGFAWHYKRYEKEQSAQDRARYADAETEARGRQIGLWKDMAPVPPWEWRRAKN